MVIVLPKSQGKPNIRIAEVPAKQGLLAFSARTWRGSVYVCFIAIINLPFKFARHHYLQQAGKRRGDELNS